MADKNFRSGHLNNQTLLSTFPEKYSQPVNWNNETVLVSSRNRSSLTRRSQNRNPNRKKTGTGNLRGQICSNSFYYHCEKPSVDIIRYGKQFPINRSIESHAQPLAVCVKSASFWWAFIVQKFISEESMWPSSTYLATYHLNVTPISTIIWASVTGTRSSICRSSIPKCYLLQNKQSE